MSTPATRRRMEHPGGRLAWRRDAHSGAFAVGLRGGALLLAPAGDGWRLLGVAPERDELGVIAGPAPLQRLVPLAELLVAVAGDLLAPRRLAWRTQPATERQLERLARLDHDAAERARARGWTAGRVSGELDLAELRPYLDELDGMLRGEAAA